MNKASGVNAIYLTGLSVNLIDSQQQTCMSKFKGDKAAVVSSEAWRKLASRLFLRMVQVFVFGPTL